MNQKRNNGFTLIELLAVIVILAIIALIAVPVIMNIISKANKSAFKDTAYGVISAGELYFAERQLEPNGMLEDITFNLPDTTKTLQLKGEIPTGQILITKEGKVAIAVQNGRYCVTKGLEDKEVIITEDYESCKIIKSGSLTALATTSTEVTSVPECLTDGTICTSGTPVAIKVNSTDVYNFYVISETNNEVTLIMDRNLGNTVAWVSKIDYNDDENYGKSGNNNKGPITSLNYLNAQTNDWINIPVIKSYIYDNNLNGTTKTHGYQKLEIVNGKGTLISQDGTLKTPIMGTSRARLLSYEEIKKIKELNDNTTPNYLYTNLSESNTNNAPLGYWILTTDASEVRNMRYDGVCYYYITVNSTINGIRPVITLAK